MTTSTTGKRVDRFVSDVLARMDSLGANPESAHQLAQWLATWLWKNATGVYRLDALETILMRRLGLEQVACAASHTPARDEVHLATEVYPFGGHTALMRQLMLMAPTPPDAILTGMSDVAAASLRLHAEPSHVHLLSRECDLRSRVIELANRLASYQRIVLHIHPNDIVAALAIRIIRTQAPSIQVHLVNHADHAFSVAVGAAHRILEISRYGWALRDKRRSQQTSTFMGIPIPSTSSPPLTAQPTEAASLLTGGSAYKFRPINGMSLPSAFAQLLQRHRRYRISVIGPGSGDWWWWPLLARFPLRVSISRLVPKETYQKLVRGCTIYVDSHPLLGGTALPEALMGGRLVAGLRGLAWGYSPSDELISGEVDAFIQQCEALANADPAHLAAQNAVRDRCISFHAPEAVRARMDQAWQSNSLVEPPATSAPAPRPSNMERSWASTGSSNLPSRRECPLNQADRMWLARAHARMKGWHHRSTWSLLRHALRG